MLTEQTLRSLIESTPVNAVEYYETVTSTNDLAKDRIETHAVFPRLIVAESQTAGRGREAKRWWTGQGAVAMSLAVQLSSWQLNRDDLPQLSPLIGSAVIKAVESLVSPLSMNLRLKLPNDVYIGDRKLAGVLIESPKPDYAVIGIGLNANNSTNEVPSEFQGTPIVSLCDCLGYPLDRVAVIRQIVTQCFDTMRQYKHFVQ